MATLLRKGAAGQLPEGYDVDTHFKPVYGPWDQRLCIVPDGDLFAAISSGKASVVTATIDRFVPEGVKLTSGEVLPADIIVTATGLNLQAFGGASVLIDGVEIEPKDTMSYKAMMLSGVPNFFFTIGYTNASWTLKADLVAEFVVRVLRRFKATNTRVVVPVRDPSVAERPFMDFEAGYVMRALEKLPKQGDRVPWMLKQNYFKDIQLIRKGSLDDGVLAFSNPRERV
ncbi:MAG: NAD(P)/FAD-dependent oxidoreductase [Marmoricola sp.]